MEVVEYIYIYIYIPHSLCRDAKNLKWRPIQKYPNASEPDLSELITETSDPTSNVPNGSQTITADTKRLRSQLSASKNPDLFFHISHFTFHISLLSARLKVT